MLKNIIGLLAGVLFGWGLLVSGMTDPAKVQGFLDVFGAWDISLALVMGGGLVVAARGGVWPKSVGTMVGWGGLPCGSLGWVAVWFRACL